MEKEYSFFQDLRRILKFEVEEVAAYIILVVLVLSIATYGALSQSALAEGTTGALSLVTSTTGLISAYMSGNELWARLFLFGFWFLIGAVIYTLLWAVVTLIVNIRNDIHISMTFVHPSSFARSEYLASTVGRTILRWSLMGGGLVYVLFWVIVIVPASIQVSENVLSNPTTPGSVWSLLFVLVTMFITLHIATIIFKIISGRSSARG